ncbi:hypothetical protein Q5H93_14870 [Hymenobacter sp. ASUV-10]|uniref:Uncharacterized protein n=1 Tax=Hymenobacter aranciens TaxID=3063996 RepID=A0ABT9BEA3_9BACT|nr:hypothetical protein [Hymenobacter sp. ASUV-10]MDO7876024.1 hypothetical protein [Hymenobacter sp. ASUV-10]
MPDQIPHPFKPSEHVPGAQVTRDDRSTLEAGLAAHVLGHRITHLEFTRERDFETSGHFKAPVDVVDLTIYLDNNVAYCARLVMSYFSIVSRGEALAHILPGEAHYVAPAAGTTPC